MQAHQELTEKLMFEYYLVSSARAGEVASPFPFFLDRVTFEEMRDSALVLDGLVRRLIRAYLAGNPAVDLHLEHFPHLDGILGLNLPLPPFYWVRFDAFIRPGKGIFFSEFNYDKPCAQREILYNNLMDPQGNPNVNFPGHFVAGLQKLWETYRGTFSGDRGKTLPAPVVGIMLDPNHYEELHLAYLYKDLLEPAGFPCCIAGAKNFRTAGKQAYAFDQRVDIILRQYPGEHGDEIENFGSLLELYVAGHVLLVNDPRSVLGQGKALFATLWELLDKVNGPLAFPLSKAEEEAIRRTIPRTWLYDPCWRDRLRAEKDNYVLKRNYSRYSEEVYIGQLHSGEEWEQVLQDIDSSPRTYVVQEFCSSEPMVVRKFSGNRCLDTTAWGNFGLYLINGDFAGLCARWSSDLLTSDDSWFSPIGLRETSFSLGNAFNLEPEDRKQLWREINDQAAFSLDYTGGYTGDREAFSLSSLELEQPLLDELYQASAGLLRVFSQALDLVLAQPRLLGPVLGIDEPLLSLVTSRQTLSLGLLGRLDWVVDEQGRPKVLEYNAETPAGLLESTGLNKLLAETAGRRGLTLGKDPNRELIPLIQEELRRIISDFSRKGAIKTIGFVSSTYYEDWQHTRCFYNLARELLPGFRFVLGEVSGLRAEHGRLVLYDIPLDAIYRYYPLDWLQAFPGVPEALGQGTMSLNPLHTYILQSKAFLALIRELAGKYFFGPGERDLICRYLPETTLSPEALRDAFVAKPYFSREGQGVVFSEEMEPGQLAVLRQGHYVFQARVHLQQLALNVFDGKGKHRLPLFPVIGIFTVGDRPAGVYTRAGGGITGKEAVYLPTFILSTILQG